MNRIWSATSAALLACLAAAPATAEEDDEIDCARLKTVTVQNLDRYDYTFCAAHENAGRASGAYGGNVSSSDEVMVAINRATFIAMRTLTAGRYTFFAIDDYREFIGSILPSIPTRNWGDERREGRFVLIPVEAKVADDSPYLSCFAFVVKGAPDALGPGYKAALGGLYCAADELVPTDDEVAEFLADVHY